MTKQKLFLLLTIIFLSVIILSTITISEITKKRISSELIDRYSEQSRILAQETNAVLKSEVANIEDKLRLIATMPEVRTGNTQACQAKLKEAFNTLETKVGNLGRVNVKGDFQCSLNEALIGTRAEALGPYINTIFNDPEHKPVLSRTIKPPGADSFIQALHVPVYSADKEFLGTLGGAIYFNELADKLFRNIKLTDNGTIVLLDDDGTVIYHTNPLLRGLNVRSAEFEQFSQTPRAHVEMLEKALTGQIGTSRYVFENIDKVASYEAHEILPNRQWIVLVTVPIADVQRSVESVGLNRLFWGLILSLAFISILAAAVFVTFLIRQFNLIDKAKDEFISIASHQLRTPLTAIRLYSEMLSGEPKYQKDSELKENLSIIHDSTLRMIKLVGDILNVSRIQIGSLKIDPKPTPIEPLIESIVEEAQPTADLKKVSLNVQFPKQKLPVINIDESLMRQVIHNLVTNAIRYSRPAEGRVVISARPSPSRDGIEVSVSDNGIGIPEEARPKIFSRFFRAENAIKHEGEGTGLGLYMAKMIMDLAHGSITFESSAKGTTFRIWIPKNGMIKSKGTKSLS